MGTDTDMDMAGTRSPVRPSRNVVSARTMPSLRGFAFCACAFVMASLACANAIKNIAITAKPELALRLPFNHSTAPAILADRLIAKSYSSINSSEILHLVKTSLTSQSINPRALRLLGFIAEAKGNEAKARKLITLSERSSRRELATQFWLIEDNIARGDLGGTIAHYDIAMRTRPESRSVLFPILAGALGEPSVRQSLAQRIQNNPPWLQGFVSHIINDGRQVDEFTSLLIASHGLPGDAAYRPLEQALLRQLLISQYFEEARRYYLTLDRSAANIISDARFTDASTDERFAPMTWQMTPSAEFGGVFEADAASHQRTARIFANSGARGVALARLLYLPSGVYFLSEKASFTKRSSGADAFWQLRCASKNSGRVLWAGQGKESSASMIVVPIDCSAQTIELQVAGGSGQVGLEYLIESFDIKSRAAAFR
jgi:hypothetical protein